MSFLPPLVIKQARDPDFWDLGETRMRLEDRDLSRQAPAPNDFNRALEEQITHEEPTSVMLGGTLPYDYESTNPNLVFIYLDLVLNNNFQGKVVDPNTSPWVRIKTELENQLDDRGIEIHQSDKLEYRPYAKSVAPPFNGYLWWNKNDAWEGTRRKVKKVKSPQDLIDRDQEIYKMLEDREQEKGKIAALDQVIAKRVYEKNYVEKKKTDSGGVVRVYDEKHVKQRWKKKVEKLKRLEKDIKKLRQKYHDDLHSDDDKTRAIAAIVGLMDGTAIRIGNEDSVSDAGTFGATTLQKKHAIIQGSKIRFKFKGKSGVMQDHILDDRAVVSEIKKLLSGKKPGDEIFEYSSGEKISAKIVNKYLKDFGISGKDLRGFHANHIMKEKMKKTKDFEKALSETAEEIGHEEKTLKNQYLDPEFVKKYEGKGEDKKDSKEKKDKKSSLIYDLIVEADYQAELEDLIDDIFDTPKVHMVSRSPGIAEEPESSRNRSESHPSEAPFAPFQPSKPFTPPGGSGATIEEKSDITSWYMHLSKFLVKEGDKVRKGQVIGLSGNTGNTTGPHLHAQLRLKGNTQNSADYAHEFYSKYTITSGYGHRTLRGKPDFHPGTDIGMPIGTPVYAWDDGVITAVRPNNGGAGNMIELTHFAKDKSHGVS